MKTRYLIGALSLALAGAGALGLWLRGSDGDEADARAAEEVARAERSTSLATYADYVPAVERSRGVALVAGGKCEEAEVALAAEVDQEEGEARARALFFLGCCRAALGREDEAREAWSRLRREHEASDWCGNAIWEEAKSRGLADAGAALVPDLELATLRYPGSLGAKRAAGYLAGRYLEDGDEWKAYRAYSLVLAGPFDARTKEEARKRVEELRTRRALAARGETYVVQAGDSLWKIARKFSTTPGLLRLANGKSSDSIRPGEQLAVLSGELLLEVSKSEHVLRVFLDRCFLDEYPVGLGANGCTPEGEFRIASKIENPPWYYKGEVIPYGDPRNILGTRWMGFENRPGLSGYGIHGTTKPESIGKDESSGCVRMYSSDVEELFDLVPIGARVVIDP